MKMAFTKNFVPLQVPPRMREIIYQEHQKFIQKNRGIHITKKKFIELKIIPLFEQAILNNRRTIRNVPIKKTRFI
jgi:hypothetical protein